ncbi:MAG: DUF1207 domain-containing protein [Gemmatimonadetes bacterium]|nr:DUF1207 domain-containing protein [Gemmatimonadota bacterium]
MKALHVLPIAFVALAACAAPVSGQRLLPEVRHFRTPVADPHAARMAVGLQRTNLLATQGPERPPYILPGADDAASEIVAAVGIGGIFPLLEVSRSPRGGVTIYADGRVFSRFRIELESRDDMGQDWFVGGGAEMRSGAWSGRAAIIHRSSHLGDEFVEMTGAERIEFGSEQLDLLAAYDVAGIARVYGGGSWIFRSYLGWEPRLVSLGVRDRALLQLGADRVWNPWSGSPVAVYAGADVQTAERTDWDTGISAALGIGVQQRRSLRLMLRFYDGPSTMGEFFLTPERFYSLELMAEF